MEYHDQVAGVLSLVSNEVSAFMICLITLDRFIVLHFPFSQVRFKRKSAAIACLVAWTIGLSLAVLPLTHATWQFYSQTSICIPLPVTRKSFPGHHYAFSVMIVLNFALFVLIAVGQAAIFITVKRNSFKTGASSSLRQSSDSTLAQRLATVVVSDFLCWFPIVVLGLMAVRGYPVPSQVNVAMAIFVLPLNSALNPFLYTINTVMEKQRSKRMKQLSAVIEARIRNQIKFGRL